MTILSLIILTILEAEATTTVAFFVFAKLLAPRNEAEDRMAEARIASASMTDIQKIYAMEHYHSCKGAGMMLAMTMVSLLILAIFIVINFVI